MRLRHLTLILLAISPVALLAAEPPVPEDAIAIAEIAKDTITIVEEAPDQYNKILSVKFKKGQGYKTPRLERIEKYALLEKYCSYFSFRFGFASYDIDNKWIEPIVQVNDAYVQNFSFNLAGGYFIGNNLAIGLGLEYSIYDTKFDVSSDILELILGTPLYDTSNSGYSWKGAFQLRNYIPLNEGQRIFLTNTTSVWYGYNYALGRNVYGDGRVTKSEQKTNTAGLGISPGIMYFMSRGFAFEFQFNPISVFYKHSSIVNNETEKGHRTSYGLNFEFMPLNLELGFSYYFGLDYIKLAKHIGAI